MSTGRGKLRALRAHLNESLFPDPPQTQRPGKRGERLVLIGGLLILAVVLQLLRAGPSAALNSLWAEDGQIFLQGAIVQGFWHTLFTAYAQYLVLVPRLIIGVATLFPLQDAPAVVSILSAGGVALSGLVVWQASAAHIRNPILRGTLVALTVLAPVAGLESVDSASYVSWYMLFATFWLLLWRPRTTSGAALAGVFIFATALSNPGVWFFIPLAGLRAIAVRGRRDLIIVASFAVAAVIQIPVLALNHETAIEPAWTSDIWTTYVQRVLDGAAFGEHAGGAAWAHFGWPFLIALLAGAFVGLVVGVMRSTSMPRYLAAVAIPTSLVMFIVSVYQRAVGEQMMWPANMHFGNGGRYVIVPALLLVSVTLALIDHASRKEASRIRPSWVGIAAAVILLLGIATSFDVEDTTARGNPSWRDSLDNAATACTTEHLPIVAVPTSPPGFGLQLPCDQIESFADAPARR